MAQKKKKKPSSQKRDIEPILCNIEPILCNIEPILCNIEPILCNSEPIPCNSESAPCDIKPVTAQKPRLRFFKIAGSLICGITIMAVLMLVLAWATFIENAYNTRVAQYAVYGSWWFELLLALLGVNLLCAALLRWPWKTRHFPFLTAHLGIIILLIGCWATARFGEEAQISIHEGEMGRFGVKFSDEEIAFSTIHFDRPAKTQSEEKKPSKPVDPKLKPKSTLLEEQIQAFKEHDLTRIPVRLGPFNWDEYAAKNWFSGDHPFKYSLYLPAKWQSRSRGVIYNRDDLKIEILDSFADSTLKPVDPLKVRTLWTPPADEEKQDWESFELPLNADSDAMENRMYRQFDLFTKTVTAQNGERISFRLAKNMAETLAFREIRTPATLGTLGAVVVRFAGENQTFLMDELYEQWQAQLPKIEQSRIKIREAQRLLSEKQSRLIAILPDETVDTTEIKSEISRLEQEIEKLKSEQESLLVPLRRPIGESGLTMEFVRLMPQSLAVVFQIRAQDGTVQSLYLFADAPENNTFCSKFGITGMYFIDPETLAGDSQELVPKSTLERIKQPRLELLQGNDQKLSFRFWTQGTLRQVGEITDLANEIHLADDAGNSVTLKIDSFTPQDLPGLRIEPLPFNRQIKGGPLPTPRVRVQVTLEGFTEQFWLKRNESLVFSPEIGEIGSVTGRTRTVNVVFPYTQLDLGFCLYLRKFERTYDPGTRTVVHYASQIDLYDINDIHGSPLERGRMIQMNQPGMFEDQRSGRKYRIYQSSHSQPSHPGEPLYDSKIAGQLIPTETMPRDRLYASTLSVNYDPGRGLKYLGCLMIVLGSLWLLRGKKNVEPGRPYIPKPVENSGLESGKPCDEGRFIESEAEK